MDRNPVQMPSKSGHNKAIQTGPLYGWPLRIVWLPRITHRECTSGVDAENFKVSSLTKLSNAARWLSRKLSRDGHRGKGEEALYFIGTAWVTHVITHFIASLCPLFAWLKAHHLEFAYAFAAAVRTNIKRTSSRGLGRCRRIFHATKLIRRSSERRSVDLCGRKPGAHEDGVQIPKTAGF
jgi:hypothetical protein